MELLIKDIIEHNKLIGSATNYKASVIADVLKIDAIDSAYAFGLKYKGYAGFRDRYLNHLFN